MELKLKNVGIISEAKITLNGLTVVTGANNSGKTTLGRALYSLVSAVEDLKKKAFLDKLSYTQTTLDNLLSPINWAGIVPIEELVDDTKTTPSLESILTIVDHAINQLKGADEAVISKRLTLLKLPQTLAKEFYKQVDRQKSDFIVKLNLLRDTLLKDPDLVEYANKRIEKKIYAEFFGQIAPLSTQTSGSPEFVLSEGDDDFFRVVLDNSTVKKRYCPSICPFAGAFFVDDGSIVDELTEKKGHINRFGNSLKGKRHLPRSGANSKAFLESFSVESHHDDLLRNLLVTQDTITGELAVEAQTAVVMNKIGEAVSFGVEWNDGRFVSSDLKIDLRNLAQGSKAFLIIKILLQNGVLRKDSLLVLDEPETHLHPEWQGLLAEATVLLVKHLGCTVLLTTHSPDFVMALDVASRKNEICEKTKFYISKKMETKMVTFDEVNDELGSVKMNDVYLHLSKSFMTLEPQRLELVRKEKEAKESGE